MASQRRVTSCCCRRGCHFATTNTTIAALVAFHGRHGGRRHSRWRLRQIGRCTDGLQRQRAAKGVQLAAFTKAGLSPLQVPRTNVDHEIDKALQGKEPPREQLECKIEGLPLLFLHFVVVTSHHTNQQVKEETIPVSQCVKKGLRPSCCQYFILSLLPILVLAGIIGTARHHHQARGAQLGSHTQVDCHSEAERHDGRHHNEGHVQPSQVPGPPRFKVSLVQFSNFAVTKEADVVVDARRESLNGDSRRGQAKAQDHGKHIGGSEVVLVYVIVL